MDNRHKQARRVLTIDPNTAGFGYVIFEGPERLVDWGLPRVGGDKQRSCLRRIAALIADYEPEVLVLEDVAAAGCRRSVRVRRLLRAVEALAIKRKIKVTRVARGTLKRVFAGVGCSNKDDVAAEIARRHAALAHRLPPRRKCWMSEDPRTSLFDAAALYLAHLEATARMRRAA